MKQALLTGHAAALATAFGSTLTAVFRYKPVSDASRALAQEVAAIGTAVHEDRFAGREKALGQAIREGVLEPLGGTWSYEAEGWYRLTRRGRKVAA